MAIAEFEQTVFQQKPIPPVHYDQAYFHTNWRAGVNNYSVDVRREIEGRNPQLIKDTFQPRRVLDFGCGPGALLYLLWELGVPGDGIDFSDYAKRTAPQQVRDHIHVVGVDDEIKLPHRYDLVICREVMEHLTAIQIQKAVQNICRLSERFVYVTTRYSKRTAELLAIDTEPEVDQSHISLLNKDFLRCMFVLQGFRSRPDLEAKMDWKQYGRVLVLEKAV